MQSFTFYNTNVHEKTQKSEVEKLGVPAEHVIVWSKNGIEHLYPIDILGEIFQLNPTKLATQLTIEDDLVKATSKSLKKGELSTLVCAKLTPKAILPEELVTKLIEPLGKAIGPK